MHCVHLALGTYLGLVHIGIVFAEKGSRGRRSKGVVLEWFWQSRDKWLPIVSSAVLAAQIFILRIVIEQAHVVENNSLAILEESGLP